MTATATAKEQVFQTLYNAAHAKGMEAGMGSNPTPMVVQQRANPLNDNSPVVQQYFVSEGACGFAWIVVKPGTSAFARWLTKKGYARKHYHGGVSIWVGEFNQSIDRKEAYAAAFAEVLRNGGITAYSDSRMD